MDKTVDGRLRRPARQDRGPCEGWNVVGARSYLVGGRHPAGVTWSDLIGQSARDQATVTVKMSAPITTEYIEYFTGAGSLADYTPADYTRLHDGR